MLYVYLYSVISKTAITPYQTLTVVLALTVASEVERVAVNTHVH